MSEKKPFNIWQGAFCVLVIIFIVYAGHVQYERTMLLSERENPKTETGIIRSDNAEIAAFLNSKLGRSALIPHEKGKLDNYMAFLDSGPGRFAYELHKHGELGSKLDFATSLEGVLAEKYFNNLKKAAPKKQLQANR